MNPDGLFSFPTGQWVITRPFKREPFQVGDGVTFSLGSDCYPMTVRRRTPTGKSLWASRDKVRAKGDRKLFIPCNVHPREWVQFTLRDDGSYRPVGKDFGRLTPGRESHFDPHL